MMMRSFVAFVMIAGTWQSCISCDSRDELEEAPEARRQAAQADARRVSKLEMEREGIVEALAEHDGVTYAMPSRSVPDWFFRPESKLQDYVPRGTLQAWEAQYDCSGSRAPACSLNYDVEVRDVANTDAAYERIRGVADLGYRVVHDRPPSFKAIRPVENSMAVETIYLNKPGEGGELWMTATLWEPVHPELARFLAQKRFKQVADFSVELVALPYSISASKPAFDEKVEFVATFDLAETRRDAAESFLEAREFDLVSKDTMEEKTSIWRHPSGWKVSLEADDSVYKRFIVYFTASGAIRGPGRAGESSQ